MRIFAGLGNPGAQYAHNRHNIGFMAVEAIAARHNATPWKTKGKAEWAECTLAGEKALLLKPVTFMNLSGLAIAPLMQFYKIAPDDLYVFHDELDLAPGKIKVKKGGGSAGHNGLKSITQSLGSEGYMRIRLGIGHPGDKARVHGHVLGNFREEEAAWLDPLLASVAAHAPDLIARPNDFTAKIMQDLKTGKDKDGI